METFILEEAEDRMNHALEHLRAELLKIRTGKSNPAMLDSVMVSYYGSMVPIQQVANVTTPDARTITVQPWEKGMLGEIEKSIIQCNLGLNPQNDGEIIRINVPPLTEERRREMVKIAKSCGEDCKVSIRNARREANEDIKKSQKEGLSEDLAKDLEQNVQQLTNDKIAMVDALTAQKEKEVLTV
jgi:ribosome recycling factor